MSGEAIVARLITKTLESNGASVANNSIGQADDAPYDTYVDGLNYPDAEFVLTCTFGTAPTEGSTISLYARPLDIDGTSDAEAPETTRPTVFIGTFTVNNVTTAQSIVLNGIYAQGVPAKADYYIHNNATGQTISTGWKLTVTPRTLQPMA